MVHNLTPVNPVVAAAVFAKDLDELWRTGLPVRHGWQLQHHDTLHSIVVLPGIREDGTIDHYHVRLGAEYYDAWPPTVTFLDPADNTPAKQDTRWLPKIASAPWMGIHGAYGYPDGKPRQLVCYTFNAHYYQTDHSPKESERWEQGRHTLAATLHRLAEVLRQPYYQGPSKQ